MDDDHALTLALCVREQHAHLHARRPLTHLKLQKLVFYAYGAALAFDVAAPLGEIDLRAWQHGPVSPEVWRHYRAHGAEHVPAPQPRSASYPRETTNVLRDAVTIYGAMDAWSLRRQSQLEAPWIEALARRHDRLARERLRDHFVAKLRAPSLRFPEYVGDFGTFALDGLPVPTFSSFHAMAEAVRAAGV